MEGEVIERQIKQIENDLESIENTNKMKKKHNWHVGRHYEPRNVQEGGKKQSVALPKI
jgi:hypothetical protein